jgi:hypothetical protein
MVKANIKIPKTLLDLVAKIKKVPHQKAQTDLSQWKSRLENLEVDIVYAKERVEQYTSEVDKLSKVETDEEDTCRKMLEQFSKHLAFDSIKAGTKGGRDYVEIQTKLLYTKIREKEGDKKGERACVGAFKIMFHPNNAALVIAENLTYAGRAHWATSGNGQVCMGDWENDIVRAVQKMDYYTAFDAMFHLLTNADLDGSAYTSSHNWRNGRVFNPEDSMITSGEYVMFLEEGYDGLNGMLGCVGLCHGFDTDSGTYSVTFRRIQDKVNWGWYCPPRTLMKIPSGMYQAQEKYEIEQQESEASQANVFKALDELKDGGTQDDADELYKKMYTKATARLDLQKLMTREAAPTV